MNKIEATCPTCGPVVCPPSDFHLSLCSYAPASHYEFACPSCKIVVTRPATPRVAKVLLELGVRVQTYEGPLEFLEDHGDGPPFGTEDVIELQRSMDDPRWLERLARRG